MREAHRQGYSDVHLGVGEGPRFRCRGDIKRTEWPTTDAATFASWLKELLSPTQIDGFRRDKEFDGSFGFDFVRVRINLFDWCCVVAKDHEHRAIRADRSARCSALAFSGYLQN